MGAILRYKVISIQYQENTSLIETARLMRAPGVMVAALDAMKAERPEILIFTSEKGEEPVRRRIRQFDEITQVLNELGECIRAGYSNFTIKGPGVDDGKRTTIDNV